MQGHRLINRDEYINTKQEYTRILSNEMRQYIMYKVSGMGTGTSKLNVRDSQKSKIECKRGRYLRSHLMKDEDGYLPAFLRKNCCIDTPGIYTSVEFTQP
jgi:hypothetical protein